MKEHVVEHLRYVPTNTPSLTGAGQSYFDSEHQSIFFYDTVRSKWLSESVGRIDVGRTGTLAAGASFRSNPGTPTSTTPINVDKNICIVGVTMNTSVAEQFVMRVDDVSGGSGTTLAINYEAAGPTSTLTYTDLTLNTSYTAGDQLDIYVLSTLTGNISNPRVTLFFRWER